MGFKNLVLGIFTFSVVFSLGITNTPGQSKTIDERENENNENEQNFVSYQQLNPTLNGFDYQRAIEHELVGSKIITKFAPKNSRGEEIYLSELSKALGYDHFNWVSYVESDPYGINDRSGRQLSTPYIDPPVGGYQYDAADKFPFYWDMVNCDSCIHRYNFQHPRNLAPSALTFLDAPTDYRLQPGEAIEFITNLVGVTSYNHQEQTAAWEVLHTFRWKLVNIAPNYNQVFLVDSDVTLDKLSPKLVTAMETDGAVSLPKTQLSLQPLPVQ